MKKLLHQKFVPFILLAVILILQIGNFCHAFVFQKEGWHCDEIYSYGLANSFYRAFIERDHYLSGELENANQWVSGDVLREYITVQPGEQFRYDSVWYNQSKDRHPPLYYAVLHTICSFFPNTFSPWFGFIINLICFAVMQIFLYKLAKNMLKSKYLALLVCFIFGFTSGALGMVLFQRMYTMVAMWTVILLYLHSKLVMTKEKPLLKQLIPLIIVMVCGALTQFLFLLIAFLIAVVFCIRYLVTKRFRVFWAYGFSMLGGVLLAFGIFPPYFSMLFMETKSNYGYMFFEQYYLLWNYIGSDTIGMRFQSIWIWLLTVVLILIVLWLVSLPIQFLWRKSQRLKNFYRGIADDILKLPKQLKTSQGRKVFPKKLWSKIKACSPMTLVLVLIIACLTGIITYTVDLRSMGNWGGRYAFVLYPIIIMGIAALISFLFSWSRYKKPITAFWLVLIAAVVFTTQSTAFFFKKDSDLKEIKSFTKDAQCLFVEIQPRFIRLFCQMPFEIEDCAQFCVTYFAYSEKYKEEIEKADTDKPIYLIVSQDGIFQDDNGIDTVEIDENGTTMSYEDYLNTFRNMKIAKELTYIGDYDLMDMTYLVYRLA